MVRRAANLLANSIVSRQTCLQTSGPGPVSSYVHLKLAKIAFGLIHVCSSVLEWPGEGPLFQSDSNKRRGGAKWDHYSNHL